MPTGPELRMFMNRLDEEDQQTGMNGYENHFQVVQIFRDLCKATPKTTFLLPVLRMTYKMHAARHVIAMYCTTEHVHHDKLNLHMEV